MGKNLVIVESPAKAKTIEKFLGKDFKVIASYGHVRDLPKAEMGIDVDHDFRPRYVIPMKARKKVNALKKEVEKAKDLYLATDLDREGEAIAWHIMKATEPKNDPKRVVFTEVTKDAIINAFKNPHGLNMDLINAQQARRILDRLVGYRLSPLLWDKVRRGLSAGRVQSVAVRFIVEREREIKIFKAQEYWQIEALLAKKEKEEKFVSKLIKKDEKRLDKFYIETEKQAKELLNELENAQFIIRNIERKEKKRNPGPPFITSTLQQFASNRLGFSAKKTMLFAQQLYEGIELGDKVSVGLITYMRTDSLNLSGEFINKSLGYINKNFGSKYKKESGRRFKSKSKTAQEAHEAIRPTYIEKSPDKIKEFLSPDQYKLYSLIYNRALASQMAEAVFDNTTVLINAKNYSFLSSGSVLKFDGFLRVFKKLKKEEKILPRLEEGEELNILEVKPIQSFTQPPARYTDASLVKILEENGIGRPSTYAPIMSTIIDRGYIKKEDGYFVPQEIGYIVNDLLVSNFSDIVDAKFTAHVESELDDVAQGETKWVNVVSEFYSPFEKDLETKQEKIKKIKLPEEKTDVKCDKCGKPMVIKIGRFGKFLACSGFPECKNTKPIVKELDIKCPLCGGNIIERRTRKGRIFYGCTGYPKCNFASWTEPIKETCRECEGLLTKNKKGDVSCYNCDYKRKNISRDKE